MGPTMPDMKSSVQTCVSRSLVRSDRSVRAEGQFIAPSGARLKGGASVLVEQQCAGQDTLWVACKAEVISGIALNSMLKVHTLFTRLWQQICRFCGIVASTHRKEAIAVASEQIPQARSACGSALGLGSSIARGDSGSSSGNHLI